MPAGQQFPDWRLLPATLFRWGCCVKTQQKANAIFHLIRTYSCHNNVFYLFKTLVSCKLHLQYPAQNNIIERQLSVNLTLSNCCMFCRRNLWALYQGKKTSLIISLTPFSWNLSVSPLTTGELIRYNLPKIKAKNVPYRACIIKLRWLTKFYYL